ncbi:hypothetical protein [Micromonospora sp. DT47]|uniref:restriction endonuclease subunit S n=1 Tax=Micromonospora sp. DT47 TaxID=3393431 RepID=UPI003CEC6CF5
MSEVRVKTIVRNVTEKSTGELLPFMGLEDIESGTGRLIPEELSFKAATDALCHRAGDVLFSKCRPYLAKSYLPCNAGTATGEMLVLRPGPEVDPKFLFYLTFSSPWIDWANTTSYGTKMPRTSWEALGEHRFWLPSVSEQRKIVTYLDRITAKIDRLIVANNAMIKLAAVRPKAYVDEALSSAARLLPLKSAVRYREGPGIMAADFRETGVPLIRVAGLKGRSASLAGCNYLDEHKARTIWRKSRVRLGDYLLSASASTGQVSVVDSSELVGAIPYTGIIILRPAASSVDMRYIEAVLASTSFLDQIDQLKAGMAMQHFGPTHLSQVRILWVDERKQIEVGNMYGKLLEQAADISSRITRVVDLLRERKSSVITAAVTGQLDLATARGVDG